MKEFKPSEKLYISKNCNSKTLEEMASVLNCKESEVKQCFEYMKKTGEYDEYRNSSYDQIVKKENEKENRSLLDLNKYLFKQLESISNDQLENEDLKKEIEKSKSIVSIAQTIINNERLLLEASKHFKKEDKQVRQVLGAGE